MNFIRNIIGNSTEIALVVKANAYGHGIPQILSMAQKCGIKHYAVASGFEASEVLKYKSADSTILVMGILYSEDIEWVLENNIEFYVFDQGFLNLVVEKAKKTGMQARIHIEVETGGNRTGLDLAELPGVIHTLKKEKNHLKLVGVCSHLAGAETLATRFRISKQIDEFEKVRKKLQKSKLEPEMYHLASSAAAIAMPEVAYDLVRVGTAAYGIWPSPDIYNIHLTRSRKINGKPLTRVFTWKTDLVHTKNVKKDEFIGYGTSYQAFRDMQVGVIPIGYANGYPREMSNRGHVLIRGRKAPVLGSVNMNMFMVDITNIDNITVGDEVVLIGRQKNNTIGLRSFSEFSSALNNEFVSRLPAAIPRSVVR
ncbi:alanine racemase [bacterium]|nr:alanine racemase [bacterium]